MTDTLNADLTERALMDTAEMDWQASPSPAVWRKRLDLAGDAEASRVTSVVRYDAGARFALHPHPCGEEILVLDGVFSDEHGDYPAGTFLLNPEGFSHAPFSRDGCVLFVKLRQYAGSEHVAVDTNSADWPATDVPGLSLMTLYDGGHGDTVRLARFDPGCRVPAHVHEGGEELYVINGELAGEYGIYPAGTWLRLPDASHHDPFSPGGCTLYVKRGHLPRL